MPVYLQVALGLVFPIAWGLVSAYLYDKLQAYRLARQRARCERAPGSEAQ